MGPGKVRMEEADLKARRRLKDKEGRIGEQRAKDQSQPASGQGLEREGSWQPPPERRYNRAWRGRCHPWETSGAVGGGWLTSGGYYRMALLDIWLWGWLYAH